MSKVTLQKWISGDHTPPMITLRLMSVWAGTSTPYQAGILQTMWLPGKPRTPGWWWCIYEGSTEVVPRYVFYNSELRLLVSAPEAKVTTSTRLLDEPEVKITQHHNMIAPPPPD